MTVRPEKVLTESPLDANQIQMLRTLRGGALLPQLLRTWLDQAPRQLRDLQKAVQSRDSKSVSKLAHSLKSASYSIGAKHVGNACAELEAAARDDKLDNALQLFSQLQQSILQVQPELERLLS